MSPPDRLPPRPDSRRDDSDPPDPPTPTLVDAVRDLTAKVVEMHQFTSQAVFTLTEMQVEIRDHRLRLRAIEKRVDRIESVVAGEASTTRKTTPSGEHVALPVQEFQDLMQAARDKNTLETIHKVKGLGWKWAEKLGPYVFLATLTLAWDWIKSLFHR